MGKDAPSTPAAEMRSLRELRALFESGRPLLYVVSAEERRVGGLLRHAARHFLGAPAPLWTWSLTEGLRGDGSAQHDDAGADARAALDFMAGFDGPAVLHLKDFHEPMRESAAVRRRLRDLNALCADRGKFVVISSPVRFLPDDLARDIACLELAAPDAAEIEAFLVGQVAVIAAAAAGFDTSDAALARMARALQGLTLDEAGYALKRALAAGGAAGLDLLPALIEEKRQTVSRTGTIEFIADGGALENVGGLGVLKKWLQERQPLFQPGESVSAEMMPKGVLVMGASGCGKSLSIKAIASYFGLPLYRIDMAEIFSGRHGLPEWAFVHACRTMEAVAPAVVWFDEIELGITSAATAGEQGRIFAFFLTWMQEKVRGLFVAATANRIDLLPAEMIRKGRFDEVFFVDLPHDDERIEIFRIHLARRGADPDRIGLQRLVGLTNGWSGAEVEQCVVSAITKARLAGRAVAFDDLFHAAARIIPLSKTMKEKVDQLRNWARDRAAPASLRE